MSETMEHHSLVNAHGVEVRFLALGGTITSIRVPDRHGELADVVPGYDTPAEYETDTRYFGAIVGRYANRIARGRFELDGTVYELPLNDGVNHLHGGPCGFNRLLWRVAPFRRPNAVGAVVCSRSPAGEQGYPGMLHTRVTYTLDDANALRIDYSAVSDAPTVVNLTQHTYFNLSGHSAGDVLDHELTINATYFTPIDASLIPTGIFRGVSGTPFDFSEPRCVGARIRDDDEQLHFAGGYDHNYMLERRDMNELAVAARLFEPRSGRSVEIFTTEPGLQFYSGNHLANGAPGKGGVSYVRHAALALETQHFPDSPNHPHFPTTILRPGAELVSTTIYRFSAT